MKTEICPYCKGVCHADYLANSSMRCGPFVCEDCGASEIGHEMKFEQLFNKDGEYIGRGKMLNPQGFNEEEKETGFYRKGKLSPYANTSNGNMMKQ